jgi:polar amino acid transport system substrate-binding protein
VDSNGAPAGISVDLAKALGVAINQPVEIRNIPFDGLIPSLKSGKIDLIISSMTSTPQRAESIDFSDPYLHTGLCLLVGRNSSVKSVADLNNSSMTVAVKQGTTGQIYASTHLQKARVLVLDKEDACVLEVIQGKAEAFIYDQISILKHFHQHQDSARIILEPFQQESWAIGIQKGRNDLRTRVNEFLARFRAQDGFNQLGQKYLSAEKRHFEEQGVKFVF